MFCLPVFLFSSLAQVTRLTIGGIARIGVVRDPAIGEPIGTMRLYENTFAKVAKTAELAKKSQALTEDEVDEQMKHACNMLNVKQVSSKDKKGVESLGLRGRKKKDMDDMDDLWGGVFADTGVDEEDAEQKKNKKDKGCSKNQNRKRKGGTGDDAQGTTKQQSLQKSPGKNDAARDKAINASEKLLLECSQLLRSLSSGSTCRPVKPAQVQGLLERLKQRTTADLISLYTKNFDPTSPESQAQLDSQPSSSFLPP